MSLVDYASSDDDVSEAVEETKLAPPPPPQAPKRQPSPPKNQSSGSSSDQRPARSAPSFEKLPDASLLLNASSNSAVNGNDHASRVAAAMAESASRKRDSNALASTHPRSKLPKGKLPHSKNVLDTAGGMLVPPQLSGRSNIVTEDISKLFVKRCAEAADPSSS